MTIRKLLTAGLVVFLLVSIVTLVAKEVKKPLSSPLGDGGGAQALPGGDCVIAYYFHGNVRCATCAGIEAGTKEALETGFPVEMKDGRLVRRIVNYEQSGNEHYVADYDLASPSVVLVAVRDGKVAKWRTLPDVWSLAGDKAALREYVQDEVRAFLDGQQRGQ